MVREKNEIERGGAREVTGRHIRTHTLPQKETGEKPTPPTGPTTQPKQHLQRTNNVTNKRNIIFKCKRKKKQT